MREGEGGNRKIWIQLGWKRQKRFQTKTGMSLQRGMKAKIVSSSAITSGCANSRSVGGWSRARCWVQAGILQGTRAPEEHKSHQTPCPRMGSQLPSSSATQQQEELGQGTGSWPHGFPEGGIRSRPERRPSTPDFLFSWQNDV